MTLNEVEKIVRRAVMDVDQHAVELVYVDRRGCRTRRTVSPDRIIDDESFAAMDLSRGGHRQFQFGRVESARLVPAHEVFAPTPLVELPPKTSDADAPPPKNPGE